MITMLMTKKQVNGGTATQFKSLDKPLGREPPPMYPMLTPSTANRETSTTALSKVCVFIYYDLHIQYRITQYSITYTNYILYIFKVLLIYVLEY